MSFFENIFGAEVIHNSDGAIGLTPELKVQYVYNYFLSHKNSVLFVCSSLYEANKYYQKFLNYTKDTVFFPMEDFLTSEALAISPELKITRLEALSDLLSENQIVVTNLMGYLRYLPPKNIYKDSFISLVVNSELPISSLIDNLYRAGYSRETIVNKTGEVAIRGYVVDLFPIGAKNPIRIEYWGDTVESIREFDVDNQLTINKLDHVIISPNTEFLTGEKLDGTEYKQRDLANYVKPVSIIDYIDHGAIFFNDYNGILASYQLLVDEMTEYSISIGEPANKKYMKELTLTVENPSIYLMNFDNVVEKAKNVKKYNALELENFTGTIESVNKRLNGYLKDKYTVMICIGSKFRTNKLITLLDNPNAVLTDIDNIFSNKINIVNKAISEGYILGNLVVISEKEIFNQKDSYSPYKTNFRMGSKVRDINKLVVGDYIVHNVHGIGIYCGIKTLTKNGLKKDYLMLEYKGSDKLYIPVERLELISKYSSAEGVAPKLSKLGGIEWQKTKIRARTRIENIAGELLKLYAERESIQGYSFIRDGEEQLEFEKEFVYEETADQLKVIDEIKRDMEKPSPMDRLLCGDVGYGKTEVAFRAIFKAIMSGKQVALLCPTTILSSQHFTNAKERFKNYPVEIEILNRFVSNKNQEKIISRLKEGKVDLVIGTHRILSEDVQYKNLGLLIVDEEQRFGVKHKEKIKQYKTNIDVLTLSATPIPRTLQMSMAGVRSLSLIETPPTNRYPIQTYVLEENRQVIKDAIYKEMARNGQVFLLYNSIEDMEAKAREISSLVPEAKIICAHGQMGKKELEDVMIKFLEREYDILLCTTIIETGIDIPSVNTLIIIDADRFGLSQLYQIRGRVGRSNKIAYCYLMYNKGKQLSDIATKRLSVIKEFTELGSGFAIAMRDLSIRGAGDILGSEQAGFVDTIGIELFMRMLTQEINKLRGIEVKEEEETDVQPLLEVSTSIDDTYVEEEELKIEIHQKINQIGSKEDLETIKIELEDRFGTLNNDILVYMHEELFENRAKSLGIEKIIQTKNSISLYLPPDLSNNINGDNLFMEACSLTRKFRFGMKNRQLIITLDTVTLDKHYIYYLIDLLDIIEKSKK